MSHTPDVVTAKEASVQFSPHPEGQYPMTCVDVIDMGERQQAVQRGIDAGGAAIEVEGAVRQITDHLVVVVRARIVHLKPEQPVLIERGEAIKRHRADIAA